MDAFELKSHLAAAEFQSAELVEHHTDVDPSPITLERWKEVHVVVQVVRTSRCSRLRKSPRAASVGHACPSLPDSTRPIWPAPRTQQPLTSGHSERRLGVVPRRVMAQIGRSVQPAIPIPDGSRELAIRRFARPGAVRLPALCTWSEIATGAPDSGCYTGQRLGRGAREAGGAQLGRSPSRA